MPAAASISSSASTKGRRSRCASRRPTVDLPTPISPTSTIGRPVHSGRIAAVSGGSGLQHGVRRYTARPRVGQKAGAQLPCIEGSLHVPPRRLVVVVLVVVVGGLFLLAGRATEQPQTRVEKAVHACEPLSKARLDAAALAAIARGVRGGPRSARTGPNRSCRRASASPRRTAPTPAADAATGARAGPRRADGPAAAAADGVATRAVADPERQRDARRRVDPATLAQYEMPASRGARSTWSGRSAAPRAGCARTRSGAPTGRISRR